MRYRIQVRGISPIVHHDGFKGLDPDNPLKAQAEEIKKRRGTNRTETDNKQLREISCRLALWEDEQGEIGIPARAVQATLENAARKFKEGPAVREGVMVTGTKFTWDTDRYGETEDELSKTAQFTVPAVVNRARVLVTRAKFDEWGCQFDVDCDDELVDKEKLLRWVDMAGRRVGLGDWRPSSPKGGHFGRFEIDGIEELGG